MGSVFFPVLQMTFHTDLLAGFQQNLTEDRTMDTIGPTGGGKLAIHIVKKMQGWIVLGEMTNRGTFQGKFLVLPPVIHHFLSCLCSEWFVGHRVTEYFLPDPLFYDERVHGGLRTCDLCTCNSG